MKIRILKNDPPKNAMGASDISGYIGKVFEASIHEEGVVVQMILLELMEPLYLMVSMRL